VVAVSFDMFFPMARGVSYMLGTQML
jgi:hypothetical protein